MQATIESDIYIFRFMNSHRIVRDGNSRLWVIYDDEDEVTGDWYVRVAYSDNNGASWTIEEVATGSDTLWTSYAIGVDSSNTIHVIWSHTGALKYQTRTSSGAWSSVTTIYAETATYSDLAVDFSDNVHVVYLDYTTSRRVVYIKKTGGSWGSPTVLVTATVDDAISFPAIIVDSNDYPHIAYSYFDLTPGDVRNIFYIYQTAGGWQAAEQVSVDGGSPQSQPAIIIDSSGNIHVAWLGRGSPLNPTVSQYLYRKRTSGVWGTIAYITDDSGVNYGYNHGLSVTGDGELHLIFMDTTSGNLYRSVNSGSGWGSKETLISAVSTGFGATLWSNVGNGQLASNYAVWYYKTNDPLWDSIIFLSFSVFIPKIFYF